MWAYRESGYPKLRLVSTNIETDTLSHSFRDFISPRNTIFSSSQPKNWQNMLLHSLSSVTNFSSRFGYLFLYLDFIKTIFIEFKRYMKKSWIKDLLVESNDRYTRRKNWNIFKVNNWHDMILMSLLLTLNMFRTFFQCFWCWLYHLSFCYVENRAVWVMLLWRTSLFMYLF